MATPSPTEKQIQTAFVAFLKAILPPGVPVIAGQSNRAAEPAEDDFVVFTPLRRDRIETNIDTSADVKFIGSISPGQGAGVLTVTQINFGSIAAGATVFGTGVATLTQVVRQTAGTPGGVGTYLVNAAQTVSEQTLSSGAVSATQATDVVYQIDVHGPSSGDNAQTIATLFRDAWSVDWFTDYAVANALGGDVVPLYADPPRQLPFMNAENQYENRWVIEAHLQANQTVSVPLQYADAAVVVLKDVDALFPS